MAGFTNSLTEVDDRSARQVSTAYNKEVDKSTANLITNVTNTATSGLSLIGDAFDDTINTQVADGLDAIYSDKETVIDDGTEGSLERKTVKDIANKGFNVYSRIANKEQKLLRAQTLKTTLRAQFPGSHDVIEAAYKEKLGFSSPAIRLSNLKDELEAEAIKTQQTIYTNKLVAARNTMVTTPDMTDKEVLIAYDAYQNSIGAVQTANATALANGGAKGGLGSKPDAKNMGDIVHLQKAIKDKHHSEIGAIMRGYLQATPEDRDKVWAPQLTAHTVMIEKMMDEHTSGFNEAEKRIIYQQTKDYIAGVKERLGIEGNIRNPSVSQEKLATAMEKEVSIQKSADAMRLSNSPNMRMAKIIFDNGGPLAVEKWFSRQQNREVYDAEVAVLGKTTPTQSSFARKTEDYIADNTNTTPPPPPSDTGARVALDVIKAFAGSTLDNPEDINTWGKAVDQTLGIKKVTHESAVYLAGIMTSDSFLTKIDQYYGQDKERASVAITKIQVKVMDGLKGQVAEVIDAQRSSAESGMQYTSDGEKVSVPFFGLPIKNKVGAGKYSLDPKTGEVVVEEGSEDLKEAAQALNQTTMGLMKYQKYTKEADMGVGEYRTMILKDLMEQADKSYQEFSLSETASTFHEWFKKKQRQGKAEMGLPITEQPVSNLGGGAGEDTLEGGTGSTHKVVSGDTLGRIAQDNGTTVQELVELNNIADPNKIRAGQVIDLPSDDLMGGVGVPTDLIEDTEKTLRLPSDTLMNAIPKPKPQTPSDVDKNTKSIFKTITPTVKGEPTNDGEGILKSLQSGNPVQYILDKYKGLKEGTDEGSKTVKYFFDNATGINNVLGTDPIKVATERAWCAAFVNSVLKDMGLKSVKGTDAMAVYKLKGLGQPVETNQVRAGDIMIKTHSAEDKANNPNALRNATPGISGHAGFVVKVDGDEVWFLAGNTKDSVKVASYNMKEKDVQFRRVNGIEDMDEDVLEDTFLHAKYDLGAPVMKTFNKVKDFFLGGKKGVEVSELPAVGGA